jgi:hypothetical protein
VLCRFEQLNGVTFVLRESRKTEQWGWTDKVEWGPFQVVMQSLLIFKHMADTISSTINGAASRTSKP